MEARLNDLKRRGVEIQMSRDDGVREKLMTEIERQRREAERRVEIETESEKDPDASAPELESE